jgi:hypothetical protein
MKWLASVVMKGVATALEQYSWGLLAAHGCDLDATQGAFGEAGDNKRTPEEREADIALIAYQLHP